MAYRSRTYEEYFEKLETLQAGGLSMRAACDAIASNLVEMNRIGGDKEEKFAGCLRATYLKRKKAPSTKPAHGNCLLDDEEEAMVIGILRGLTRAGEHIKSIDIVEVCRRCFPDRSEQSFSRKWSPIFLFSSSPRQGFKAL